MKKILITGAGSYIGQSFETYMASFGDAYAVDTVDMLDPAWRERSFSGYDCVFHVAGIAHQKETKENAHLYREVNRDLAIEVAGKAKADGVGQFIFLSSMSVYGKDTGVITKETAPTPKTHYGVSKWEAEQGIVPMADEDFRVCILRPPMVYGKGCKGNFVKVKNLVEKLPFFPRVKNKRSMIYIDNLVSFVKRCIDHDLSGWYFPQNKEYVQTTAMASVMAKGMNKRLRLSCLLGWGVWLMRPFVGMVKKAFGTLVYENTEEFDYDYCVTEFEESIYKSI